MKPQQQQQHEHVVSLINFDVPACNDELNAFIKNTLKDCPECKANPAVLLTSEKIPCCRKDWLRLADKNISWSSAKQ